MASAPNHRRGRNLRCANLPPEQLLANPANWRVHPREQQQALAGALSEVGWVQQILVNKVTGYVVVPTATKAGILPTMRLSVGLDLT
jgi:hypothetical protein